MMGSSTGVCVVALASISDPLLVAPRDSEELPARPPSAAHHRQLRAGARRPGLLVNGSNRFQADVVYESFRGLLYTDPPKLLSRLLTAGPKTIKPAMATTATKA